MARSIAPLIQILSVEGCPNVDRAREAVRRGLALSGLAGSVPVEEIVGEFASPTVLVDGRDVTGHSLGPGSSCRLDVATEDQVAAALAQDAVVACSLTGADLGTQLERWQALWAAAGIDRVQSDDGICLVFRDEPGVESALDRLVAVENECCSWASWVVSRDDGALSIHVRSSGAGTAALHEMFGFS